MGAERTAEGPDRTALGLHAGSRIGLMTDMDAGFGWEVGLALRIPTSEKVNLSIGADFYFGDIATTTIYGEDMSYNEMGISIPVFAQYKVSAGIPVYMGGGVQLGVNFGTKTTYSGIETDVGDARGTIDIGVGAGLGCLLTPNLDVGFRYVYNINETLTGSGAISLFSIGVTYLF
jgi:opacity protein-like surface antigen